ncbi:type II toxin-antitoxin system VapC family toxin [Haloferula sp. A504]|uniref:type II toxin-antitoxin system VapC family toxin n=1 Tax=Haloferula sp. A504 TaxID=3373601 RepID=UPI0031C3002D|nr:type II toxin-antitoxin system VapC family toxin [Verrucomicrobiaceae bacterium E54]
MAFLLDINVLSELRKGNRAKPAVRAWAAAHADETHHISVLAIGEIRKGIAMLKRRSPEQAAVFESWLETLKTDYAPEILPITPAISERWGELQSIRSLPVIDGLIASTALEHQLVLATRNTRDFEGIDVALVNPFEYPAK